MNSYENLSFYQNTGIITKFPLAFFLSILYDIARLYKKRNNDKGENL